MALSEDMEARMPSSAQGADETPLHCSPEGATLGEREAEELVEACERLRKLEQYLTFWRRERLVRHLERDTPDILPSSWETYRPDDVRDVEPRPARELKQKVRDEKSRLEALKRRLYEEAGVDASLEKDLLLLQKFLSHQAAHIGCAAVAKRRALIEHIEHRYQSQAELTDLAKDLSVFLAHKSSLPLCLTIEQSIAAESDPSVTVQTILYAEDIPRTAVDAEALLGLLEPPEAREVPPPVVPLSFLILSSLFSGSAPAAPALDRWRRWTADEESHSPFSGKIRALEAITATVSSDGLRRNIHQAHPIVLMIPHMVSPLQLADILRLSDADTRNGLLADLVSEALSRFKQFNEEMAEVFEGTNKDPGKIDWGDYTPLLVASATHLVSSEDDPLNVALEISFNALDRWSWMEIAEWTLIGLGLVVLCASLYWTGPLGVLVTGVALTGLDAPSLALSVQQFREAVEKAEQEKMDGVFLQIRDGVEIVESQAAPNMAAVGLLLELLGVLPLKKMKDVMEKASAGPAKSYRDALSKRIRQGGRTSGMQRIGEAEEAPRVADADIRPASQRTLQDPLSARSELSDVGSEPPTSLTAPSTTTAIEERGTADRLGAVDKRVEPRNGVLLAEPEMPTVVSKSMSPRQVSLSADLPKTTVYDVARSSTAAENPRGIADQFGTKASDSGPRSDKPYDASRATVSVSDAGSDVPGDTIPGRATTTSEGAERPLTANERAARMHPEDRQMFVRSGEDLDPRLQELRGRLRPYESFQSHEEFKRYVESEFVRYSDAMGVPIEQQDALYEELVRSDYGRAIAERGLDPTSIVRAAKPSGFRASQGARVDEAVQHGTRLDSGWTHYTIRGVRLPEGGSRPQQVININYEIIDTPDVNGTPSVVLVLRFNRSEFDAIGIGNYEQRFLDRYAQANAAIADWVEWDGRPAILLPPKEKKRLKRASDKYNRHLKKGTGYKDNVDEALQLSWDGRAIPSIQRNESDLINGIYSTADKTLLDWAKKAVEETVLADQIAKGVARNVAQKEAKKASKSPTIGIAGIKIEFVDYDPE